MNIVKKEIREALLGDLVSMDRRLVVSGMRRVKYRNGLREGFGSVLIMGVMCSRRWYMTKKSAKQIRELAVKAMQDMGRMMILQSLPEAEAVYCTYLLNHPAILTFTQSRDGIIEVAAYSARDLSGMLAAYRTLNRFQKAMHDVLERMSEEGEQKKLNAIREQNMAEKQAKKQAKLDRKQTKKQAKLAKKQEREQKRQNGLLSLLGRNVKADSAERPKQDQKRSPKQNRSQGAVQQELAKVSLAAMEAAPAEAGFVAAAGQAETVEAKLTAELMEAKLAAEAAEARLAAAEARLAAEQAQAKLAEMQAKLAAAEQSEPVKQTAVGPAVEQAPAENHSPVENDHNSSHNNSRGSTNGNSGNSRKKNRKKKK